MRGVHVRDAGAGARHDRLHALAISVADQPHRIAREVLASLRRAKNVADALEKFMKSLLGGAVDLDVHDGNQITPRSARQASIAHRRVTDRNDPTSKLSLRCLLG